MALHIVDVHAHMTDPLIRDDLAKHLDDAYSSGVAAVVGVCESTADITEAARIVESVASSKCRLAACLGVHPVQIQSDGSWRSATLADVIPALAQVRLMSANPWVVGIGECGLDFCPRALGSTAAAETSKCSQQEALRAQARLARELHLPLNVHSRSAGHHTLSVLYEEGIGIGASAPSSGTHGAAAVSKAVMASTEESPAAASSAAGVGIHGGGPGAVLHAFDGKAKFVREAVERGFCFSVPPCVARSPVMQKWVKCCPLDRLLLETDSPALPEVKGVVNTPAAAAASLRLLSEMLDRPQAEVAEATTRNAMRLFPRLGDVLRL
jgi:TatD DNase family protein